MTSEVDQLISFLLDGTMSLDEVAERFRSRRWPRRSDSSPQTHLELAIQSQQDPEPFVPGSFDDVEVAYSQGKITDDQYDVLAEAMAQSMREEDRRKAAESPDVAG